MSKNRIKDVGLGLKQIFSDVSEMIALSTMEGVVLGVFDRFSLEDLYFAIVDGKDLWLENWGEYEQYRGEIRLLVEDARYTKYKDFLTVENILEWMRRPDGKPEFASIIVNTSGGAKWLEAQIGRLLQIAEEPIALTASPVDAKQVTSREGEAK